MRVKKNRIAGLFTIRKKFVVRPGFEPRQTVPKTVVLPLYYRTIFHHKRCSEMECKFTYIFYSCKSNFKKN